MKKKTALFALLACAATFGVVGASMTLEETPHQQNAGSSLVLKKEAKLAKATPPLGSIHIIEDNASSIQASEE